jgi:hypothetical protein
MRMGLRRHLGREGPGQDVPVRACVQGDGGGAGHHERGGDGVRVGRSDFITLPVVSIQYTASLTNCTGLERHNVAILICLTTNPLAA